MLDSGVSRPGFWTPPVSAPVYSLRIFQLKYQKILWEFQIFVYAASTNALVQIILAQKSIH